MNLNFIKPALLSIVVTFLISPAQGESLEGKIQNLVDAAKGACDFPEKIHPVSESALRRFLKQVLPEVNDPVLATAFLKGFTAPNSSYLPYGYCVAVFLNQPKDPSWEVNLDAYGEAEKMDALPTHVFVGLSSDGVPLFTYLE